MISIDSKFNKVEVRNTYAQTSFETVERAIADFAEEFDVRVNSLTEEEMRAEAESAFRRAEELLANYQAAPENIRNAILRYGNAMKYYEQFEPKPREWDICRKQLEKANKIYKNIYEGLVFNIQRYNKLRQFDKASGECQKMLELVDPDSPDFRKYKAYKVAFDKQLRRKK
jgi:tetratricopeptide (TPR) repeat protein